MTDKFDLSRLSNAGKEAARTHKQLRKAAERLKAVVDEAIAADLSSRQIENAMLKFCSTHEQVTDAVSLFMAMNEIEARKGTPQ